MLYENNLNITLQKFFQLMSKDSKDYKTASKESLQYIKGEYTDLLGYVEAVYSLIETAKSKKQMKGLLTPNFIFSVRGKCASHLDIINKLLIEK